VKPETVGVREKSSAEGAGEGAVGIDVAGTWVEGDEVVGALVGSFEGAYVKPGTVGARVEGSLLGKLVLGDGDGDAVGLSEGAYV
jgi:hypothetical protein